jgi:topoisomerase IA-like protein
VMRWEKKVSTASSEATKPLYESATYCVLNGPYGPYIRKKSKTRTPLVSVPKEASLTNLTEEIVRGWYQSKRAVSKRPSHDRPPKQKKSTE